jgi:hypothetical protein
MKELLNENEVTQEVERHLRYTPNEFVDRVMASAQERASWWQRGFNHMRLPAFAAQGLAVAGVAVVSVALVASLHRGPSPTGNAPANATTPTISATVTRAPSPSSAANGSHPTGSPAPAGSNATGAPSAQPTSGSQPQPTQPAGGGGSHGVILGDTSTESLPDYNDKGIAEAFQVHATSSASLINMSVFVDTGQTGNLVVGLYSSNGSSQPGTRLTWATVASPTPGSWNTVSVSAASLTSGQQYWIAVLSTTGQMHFRTALTGSCTSYGSDPNAQLPTLPPTWITTNQRTFTTSCPVSAYGSS